MRSTRSAASSALNSSVSSAPTIVVIARTTWRMFAQTFGSMGFRTRFAVILAIFILMVDGTSALATYETEPAGAGSEK
jgi:hypothetical protein